MPVRINNNLTMSRARVDLNRAERDSQTRREHLSSGLRITKSSDDTGYLSVSEGMRAEIGGLTEGTRNTERALDLLRVAEGALNEISSVLIRMRELTVEASTDTLTDLNRESLDAEFDHLKDHIDRIARLASYNDQTLLSGFGNEISAASTALADSAAGVQRLRISGAQEGVYTFADSGGDSALTLGNGVVSQTLDLGVLLAGDRVATGTTLVADFERLGVQVELAGVEALEADGDYLDGELDGRTIVVASGTGGSFQLGSDATPADRLEFDLRDMLVDGAVVDLATSSVNTTGAARAAMAAVDLAIQRTVQERGAVGAVVNRLEYTLNFTTNAIEQIQAAESTVRDADFADESLGLARNQILAQSAKSVMIHSRLAIERVMEILL